MPVPLMGFFLQGFSPSQSLCSLSGAVTFLALACGDAKTQANFRSHLAASAAFKALLSVRIRHLGRWGEPHCRRPLPSWFFVTSRGFPPASALRLREGPLMSFAEPPVTGLAPSAQRHAALQGLDHRGIGLSTRDRRPFWPSCTFSVSRRFKIPPRLVYRFTPSP